MYKKVDLSVRNLRNPKRLSRDTWYEHIRIELFIGRVLGMILITRNEDGTYTRTYASLYTSYFLFVSLMSTYICYTTLAELMDHFHASKVPGSYMLFITLFSYPLPILFVFESRKMPEFFNQWRKFQLDFLEVTGIELDFTGNWLRIFGFVLKITFSSLFITLQLLRFPVLTNRGNAFIVYQYWIVATITSFWDILIFFLVKSGNAVHELAKSIVRSKTVKVTFEEVEIIWFDLYRLLKKTGHTFCFTYCYFILFMFLILMVTTYETLITLNSPMLLEKIVFIVLTIITTLHTASIPFTSQMAAKKIGEDFYKLLFDLKTKEKSWWVKPEEMDGLLQAISDNQPMIDLGGFVTLDNGLITSLMSTMVTYLIVLVQFKIPTASLHTKASFEMIPPLGRYLTNEEVLLCDLQLTDEIHPCRNLYVRFFRLIGFLVASNGQSGRLQSRWMSVPFFYCFALLLFHFFIIYVAGVERNRLLSELTERSFDEDLFLYSQYAFFLFEGLPLVLILESRKITAFCNSLAVFQARHYHVKGDLLNLRFGLIHKYFFLVFIISSFIVLFYENFNNIQKIYKELDDNVLAPFIENLISTAFIIADILATNILYLGNVASLFYVIRAFLQELTNVFRSGDETLLDDYEKLWVDLMYVITDLINGMAYSIGYYFVVAILLATFELFLAIQKDHADLILYGASLWVSMTILHMCTDHIVTMMTEKLKHELIEVKKEVSRKRKLRINGFFRVIGRIRGRCSLAGFVTFDNGLASSVSAHNDGVLNNITTYIIILLQFRKDNQQVG